MNRTDFDPRQRGSSARSLLEVGAVASFAVISGTTIGMLVPTQISQSPEDMMEPTPIYSPRPIATINPEFSQTQELIQFLITKQPGLNNPDNKTFDALLKDENLDMRPMHFIDTPQKEGNVTEPIGLKMRKYPSVKHGDDFPRKFWLNKDESTSWTNAVRIINKQNGTIELWAARKILDQDNQWGFNLLYTKEPGKEPEIYVTNSGYKE